jgi:hypothetical protein
VDAGLPYETRLVFFSITSAVSGCALCHLSPALHHQYSGLAIKIAQIVKKLDQTGIHYARQHSAHLGVSHCQFQFLSTSF